MLGAPASPRAVTAPCGAGSLGEAPDDAQPDLARRRQTHFVLWRPADADRPPSLVIGRFAAGDPPTLVEVCTLTSGSMPRRGSLVDRATGSAFASTTITFSRRRAHARTADRVPEITARADRRSPPRRPTTQRSRSTSSLAPAGPDHRQAPRCRAESRRPPGRRRRNRTGIRSGWRGAFALLDAPLPTISSPSFATSPRPSRGLRPNVWKQDPEQYEPVDNLPPGAGAPGKRPQHPAHLHRNQADRVRAAVAAQGDLRRHSQEPARFRCPVRARAPHHRRPRVLHGAGDPRAHRARGQTRDRERNRRLNGVSSPTTP